MNKIEKLYVAIVVENGVMRFVENMVEIVSNDGITLKEFIDNTKKSNAASLSLRFPFDSTSELLTTIVEDTSPILGGFININKSYDSVVLIPFVNYENQLASHGIVINRKAIQVNKKSVMRFNSIGIQPDKETFMVSSRNNPKSKSAIWNMFKYINCDTKSRLFNTRFDYSSSVWRINPRSPEYSYESDSSVEYIIKSLEFMLLGRYNVLINYPFSTHEYIKPGSYEQKYEEDVMASYPFRQRIREMSRFDEFPKTIFKLVDGSGDRVELSMRDVRIVKMFIHHNLCPIGGSKSSGLNAGLFEKADRYRMDYDQIEDSVRHLYFMTNSHDNLLANFSCGGHLEYAGENKNNMSFYAVDTPMIIINFKDFENHKEALEKYVEFTKFENIKDSTGEDLEILREFKIFPSFKLEEGHMLGNRIILTFRNYEQALKGNTEFPVRTYLKETEIYRYHEIQNVLLRVLTKAVNDVILVTR